MGKRNTVITTMGLTLFGFVASKLGWSDILRQLPVIAAALPFVFALSALRTALQTAAWSNALRACGIQASTTNLIGARLASRAMGYLSVLGPLLSEPMRISLLANQSQRATAATVIDMGVYSVSCCFLTILGIVCAVQYVSEARRMWSLLMLVPLAGVVFLIVRRKAILPGLARRLGYRCPSWLRKSQEVESAIRDFQSQHPACIRRMFCLGVACQVLMSAEIAAMFLAFGIPCHLGVILSLETASRLIKAVGGWLPARIGADESGMAAAFLTFGLSSMTGLAVALACRVRDLTEAAVGLCWLAWRSRSVQRERAHVREFDRIGHRRPTWRSWVSA